MSFEHLCACGCGQETKMMTNNNATRGFVKGNYFEFAHGHNQKGKKYIRTEQHKVNMSAAHIGNISGFFGKKHTIETRIKISKGMDGKVCLEKNPNWQGGMSYRKYTFDFNPKLKRYIKHRDGRCMVCNTNILDLKVLKRPVCIHHIDYKKENSFPQNLITLCLKCHVATNMNRQHWTVFFQSMLKEQYGYQYTEDQKIIIDFEKVIENGIC